MEPTKQSIQIDSDEVLTVRAAVDSVPENWVETEEKGTYRNTLPACPLRRFSYGIKSKKVSIRYHCLHPQFDGVGSHDECQRCSLRPVAGSTPQSNEFAVGDVTVKVGPSLEVSGGEETVVSGGKEVYELLRDSKAAKRTMPPVYREVWDLTKSAGAFVVRPVFVTQEVYNARLEVCDKCDTYRENNRCTACGCFIAIKARVKVWMCPHKFWSE